MKKFLTTVLCLTLLILSAVSEQMVMVLDESLNPDLNVYRQMVIRQNLEVISLHNSNPDRSFQMKAYPQFIGLTIPEFKARYVRNNGILIQKQKVRAPTVEELTKLRKNILISKTSADLSKYDPTIYNQGSCGNCYAYGSVGSVNINMNIQGMGFPKLSIQQLTDCSNNASLLYSNFGCNGGNPIISMEYIAYYGLVSMEAYPISSYCTSTGQTQPCKSVSSQKYKIYNFYIAQTTDCSTQVLLLSYQYSMATAMYAANEVMQNYESGIINSYPGISTDYLDHAVMIVGFNKSVSKPYLKIKNSWGTSWGENGYFRVALAGNIMGMCYQSVSPYG